MAFKKPQKTEMEKGIKPGLTPSNAKSQTRKAPKEMAKPWSVGR